MNEEAEPTFSHWQSIRDQLKRNSIAYLSLFIAITGLLYNTWRNETSEYQRNLRDASFFAIEQLANFQSAVNDAAYSGGCDLKRDFDAWSNVLALRTLAQVLPEPAMLEILSLDKIWQDNHTELCAGTTSLARRATIDQQVIYPQVKRVDQALVELIKGLD